MGESRSDPENVTVSADHYFGLLTELDRYRVALRLIAAPKRPDGTYNRSREACEELAREALGDA